MGEGVALLPLPRLPRRILLVRLRQIGDVVFTTPAVHALRRRFPDAHLTYIVEPAAAPVVVGNPHLNDVIVAPRGHGLGGFLADMRLGRRLRAERYDLAIRRQHLDLPRIQTLLDILSRSSFRRELESLGGYDTKAAGQRIL